PLMATAAGAPTWAILYWSPRPADVTLLCLVPARPSLQPRQLSPKFYSMAAQIKLLLEIPEKMWSAMEASRYLHATQLYLLCRHLHSLLQLEAAASRSSPVLARFPILVRQVAAASHFRAAPSARTACPCRLSTPALWRLPSRAPALWRPCPLAPLPSQRPSPLGAPVPDLSRACPLVPLPPCAPDLLAPQPLPSRGPAPAPSHPSPCPLAHLRCPLTPLPRPLGKGAGVLQGEMKLCSWFRHLPASVVEFQPALRTLAHPISQEYLRDSLQKWVHMCKEDIKNGITSLLMYVKSMKALAAIRDAVWDLLTHEAASHSWDVICRRLLEQPLSFWEDMMQQLFLDRLQTLTREGFDSIASSCEELLASALQELEGSGSGSSACSKHVHYEQNMCLFLWSESAGDLPPDAAWVTVANRAPAAGSGLSMKARAVSPCVQGFCSALDAKLKVKLDDLLAYLPSEESPPPQAKNSAFDRYADAGTVRDLLRAQSAVCIGRITGRIQAELRSIEEAVQGQQAVRSGVQLHAVLFMARLCQSLGELCPHLKQCIVGKPGSPEKPAREPRALKKAAKGKGQDAAPTQAEWQEVREMLLQQSVQGYRVWSAALVKVLTQRFAQSLLLDDAGSVLATATSWDELEIQEETESGGSITSTIRLPTQPSWYVQSFLFSLCQEINRVGGHALPKVTLQEMLRSCMAHVVAAYEQLAGEQQRKEGAFPVTQNRALQLLYDLRYLSLVLTAKGEEGKSGRSKPDSRIEKVTDYLEGLIDPFDLDVFTPHLNSNLTRLVQRTSVLFGLVTGTENQFTSRSNAVNSQEAHNILPLASSQIRFGLLPLSMTSNRKAKLTRSVQTKAQADPPALSRAEDPMTHAGSLFRQLVSEEDDTSAPSLFKLGWLSSMTK
uniref:Conserved oligomeric Golgi complex subunit 1 n=1 Tax=Oryctolagus cuniculus TaxID=9986 RepID=G1T263_RABIT